MQMRHVRQNHKLTILEARIHLVGIINLFSKLHQYNYVIITICI